MDQRIFDHPTILTEKEVQKLGIDLSKLEKIATEETPMIGVFSELKKIIRDSSREQGAYLVVLTKEECYGGVNLDKYKYTCDLYGESKRL